MSFTSLGPRRVAVLSVHTSPLELPGIGDAGGMNVYIRQTATRMARRGVEVDVFTRATSADQAPTVELTDGVTVHHVRAGPYAGLGKHDLPAQLDEFSAGVTLGDYSAMHSHYWLSGQVGRQLHRRWGLPLIHSAHTLAKVKNAARAADEPAEPEIRTNGEQRLAEEADLLVANTEVEAQQLIELYDAERSKVLVVPPGVDLDVFTPGDPAQARAELGIPADALVLGFVGRIQPLKAPDVLLRAAAELLKTTPSLRERLVLLIVGGPSGSGLARPAALIELARELGIAELTRFCPPRSGAELATAYRAMDLLAVPSYNESFGLVALEAQACGTPVVAARVGGLPIAVQHASTGVLVDGHHPVTWGAELAGLLTSPIRRRRYTGNAVRHAARYSWERTTDALLRGYRSAAAGMRTRHADEEIAV